MHDAARPFVRRLFRRSGIPLEVRAKLMKVLMFSRCYYNAGVWPELNVAEASAVHRSAMRLVRQLCVNDVAGEQSNVSDMAVLEMTSLMAQ